MSNQNELLQPKAYNERFFPAIRKNLALLMECTGINQSQLTQELENRGMQVNQGNLSKFLSGKSSIQFSTLMLICEIYHVTMEQLTSDHFQYTPKAGSTESQLPKLYSNDLLLHIPYLGEAFVIDPSDPHFFGYLQTYHVYLFPSQSDEEKLRTGTLKLMANGSVCEAVLEIDTNKLCDGKPVIKVYRGRCIISTTIRAVYILLTDSHKGELSVLNFRYFNLMQLPLDCRIAGTLINATGEDHPPTLQRMFLSRTELAPEHLNLLIPHLYLNSGAIRLHSDQLQTLRQENESYAAALDELTAIFQPSPIYCFDEDAVLSCAKRHLSKPGVHTFLSRLRSLSEHNRFNKASRRADQLSHKLLRSLGYFHDHDN